MGRSPRWGQLNAGQTFNVLALDIDRAISLADLRRYELALLEQARELGWHGAVKKKGRLNEWPDPVPARLDLKALADKTGVDRRSWQTAKARLLQSRIFLPGPRQNEVWINKNAQEWVDPTTGEPRLSSKMLAYCQAARPPQQAELPIAEPVQTDPENPPQRVINGSRGECSVDHAESDQRITQRVINGSRGECSVDHAESDPLITLPLEERTRGDLRRLKKSIFSDEDGDKKNGLHFAEDDEDDIDWMAEATGQNNGDQA